MPGDDIALTDFVVLEIASATLARREPPTETVAAHAERLVLISVSAPTGAAAAIKVVHLGLRSFRGIGSPCPGVKRQAK